MVGVTGKNIWNTCAIMRSITTETLSTKKAVTIIANKPKKYRVIKFPTGVIAYLDENDVLQGTPASVIAGLSRREKPHELNDFEVFVKNFLSNNGK
jgi:hypothetical protein